MDVSAALGTVPMLPAASSASLSTRGTPIIYLTGVSGLLAGGSVSQAQMLSISFCHIPVGTSNAF